MVHPLFCNYFQRGVFISWKESIGVAVSIETTLAIEWTIVVVVIALSATIDQLRQRGVSGLITSTFPHTTDAGIADHVQG